MAEPLINADLHNHTKASHGLNSVDEMYQAAKDKNLRFMGFAEHSPLPPGIICNIYTGDLDMEFPLYIQRVLELKSRHEQPIPLLGMELDWIPSKRDWMRQLVERWPFDYVLGSLHYVDGYSTSNIGLWEQWQGQKARFGRFEAYFNEMKGMLKSGLIQIASHPDFIKFRVWPDFQLWLESPQSRDYLVDALETMAANEVAMEINAAGFRRDFHEPYPAPAIMRLAKDAGVRITFGSDAHAASEVAKDMQKLHEYAASFGFKNHLIFVGKKPLEFGL